MSTTVLLEKLGVDSSKITLQFGKTENQIYHTFRHTDELGLNRSSVQNAIQKDFKNISSELINGEPLSRK